MLTDTHAHLSDFSDLESEIINKMGADDLGTIIAASYDLDSAYKSRDIAQKNKDIYFTAGVHPSNTAFLKGEGTEAFLAAMKNPASPAAGVIGGRPAYCEELLALSRGPKCVAIGEIGLDYHYEDTNREVQKLELLRQLDVVEAADLPVVFHVRDSYEDMLDIIKSNLHKLPRRGVMHCFAGSLETAKIYVDMGFYISFSGVITFKNAKKFPEIIRALPKDRVLIETDCPYLAPDPYRGQTNYPKYVRRVAEKLSEIWGTDYEEAAALTSANARAIFTKIKD